jgi:predicted transcriptional regulator of viral defense system
MESYNLAVITKKVYDSGLTLFTHKTLRDLLDVSKSSTYFNIIKRLEENHILQKVERNKYHLLGRSLNDFSLASLLYQPSYISFESALNYYGILSQFPYETTSATPKKSQQKVVDEKIFTYNHLDKRLFWGYEKINDFLIALPEKALLDQLYLNSKGLKSLSLDEYDLSHINPIQFKQHLSLFPRTRQFQSQINLLTAHNYL